MPCLENKWNQKWLGVRFRPPSANLDFINSMMIIDGSFTHKRVTTMTNKKSATLDQVGQMLASGISEQDVMKMLRGVATSKRGITKKVTTKEERKAARKRQKMARKASRGSLKGQKATKGKQFRVNV